MSTEDDDTLDVDDGVEQAAVPQDATEVTDDKSGRLPSEITLLRRAQQCLLGWGVIYHSKHPDLYRALQANRAGVARMLGELGLSMSMDETYGIALLRVPYDEESDEEQGPHPMVRRSTLSLMDTLMALVLRDYYRERQGLQDITIQIDLETIESRMRPFLAIFSKSETLGKKKISGAIDRFRKWHILDKVRGDDSMFEITPVIAIVVNAQWLEPMLEEYRELLESTVAESAGADDEGDDGEVKNDE